MAAAAAAAAAAASFGGGRQWRYEFKHPEDTGHSSSPFESFWFVNLAKHGGLNAHAEVTAQATKAPQGQDMAKEAPGRVVATVDELRAQGLVPTAKRANPKQRRKQQAAGK